jgi:hypothetical protein
MEGVEEQGNNDLERVGENQCLQKLGTMHFSLLPWRQT